MILLYLGKYLLKIALTFSFIKIGLHFFSFAYQFLLLLLKKEDLIGVKQFETTQLLTKP